MESPTRSVSNDGHGRRTRRAGLVLGVAGSIGVTLVVLIALLFASTAREATFSAGSPEAAFAAYARAWEAGDADEARSYFTTEAASRVPSWAMRQADETTDEDVRAFIQRVDVTDEGVVLILRVERSYQGLFSTERYDERVRVPMVEEAGAWRIARPLAGYQRIWFEKDEMEEEPWSH